MDSNKVIHKVEDTSYNLQGYYFYRYEHTYFCPNCNNKILDRTTKSKDKKFKTKKYKYCSNCGCELDWD
jgi:transcription elongation factor Elf1